MSPCRLPQCHQLDLLRSDHPKSMMQTFEGEVIEAKVVALFPPRPEAIVTLLHSDGFLPGVQTLLYSLKKTLKLTQTYPPEIVVLATSNVSEKSKRILCPALCTRILHVEEWAAPVKTIDTKLGKKQNWTRTLDDHNPGWTKLRMFGLAQYETILYVDSDCLVLQDVSGLLELNRAYTESEALIAAAPDILPPSNFNSGVMVIRPSVSVLETMQRQASLLTTFDGSDTGFLNAFYSTWNTEFPPTSRLPVGFNAQQAMYDMTVEGSSESSFWDVQIGSDLYIIHYSNSIKPWEAPMQTNASQSLTTLWRTWYKKSNNFLSRFQKDQLKSKQLELDAQKKQLTTNAATRQPAAAPQARNTAPNLHKLVTKRFKELRSMGVSTQQAMKQAREELLPPDAEETDVGSQVAAMFGMR